VKVKKNLSGHKACGLYKPVTKTPEAVTKTTTVKKAKKTITKTSTVTDSVTTVTETASLPADASTTTITTSIANPIKRTAAPNLNEAAELVETLDKRAATTLPPLPVPGFAKKACGNYLKYSSACRCRMSSMYLWNGVY
jgi:hypothetical protein